VDLQRVCKNHSFATVQAMPRLDRHGFDIALIVTKLTYAVDPIGNVSLVPSVIHLEDVPDGHGAIRNPTDFEEEKVGTDVGLVGTALPSKPGVTQQLVWLQVGGHKKGCMVFGPRAYVQKGSGVVPGPASVLKPTPLVHALSFGGSAPGRGLYHRENPVGRGFTDDPLSLVGQPAHRLEPVQNDDGVDAKIPAAHACFAPIPATWEPRASLAGTHDAKWADERAPVRPVDFDPLHHSWAVPDLHQRSPLAPDVPIEVGGATAHGVWRFKLPAYSIELSTRVDGVISEIPTHLDSYLIDIDAGTVELTFRAAIRLRRKWERLEKVYIYGAGEMPDSVFESPARPAGAVG
jgi:hypothetical protein